MSPLRSLLLALGSVAAIAAASVLPGCGGGGGDPVDGVVVGDEVTSVITVDGEFVRTTTYKVHELEPHDALEAVVLLPHLHVVDDLRAGTRSEHSELLSDIEHVTSFLQGHWDGHVGGHGDEGTNSHEFVRFLRDHGVSPRDFLEEFERANAEGMTVNQFVSALESVRANLPGSSPDHFLSFLHHTDRGLKEFLADTQRCHPAWDDYLRAMQAQQLDFDALLERYDDSGDDACAAIATAQGSLAPAGGRIASLQAGPRPSSSSAANGVLAITQRKWSCINKGNIDCGALSSVLNVKDRSPFSYWDSQDQWGDQLGQLVKFEGDCHTWFLGFKHQYTVEVYPVVSYGARHDRLPGRYIQGIYFQVPRLSNKSSCTVDAEIHLGNLQTADIAGGPDPSVEVEFDLILQKNDSYETKRHCTWIVQASTGFVGRPSCTEGVRLK